MNFVENLTVGDNLEMAINETVNISNYLTKIDIMSYPAAQVIFFIEYVTIFLIGIFGNCLVCYVVFKNKHMQTVTNYFITNLALADILLCAFAVPFTPIYFYMKEWVFGQILCKILPMAQGTSVYVSTLTLTSIAIDRYFVIIYPFRARLSLNVCYCIIISIWLFSLSVTLPYALYMGQAEYNDQYFCEELWPSELIRKMFGIFTIMMQLVMPFIAILYCYVKIFQRMNQRVRAKPGSKSARREETERERKRRTNRMLIGMVTIFAVSWLPMNVVNVVGDYDPAASNWKFYNLSFFIAHVVAMSSTCYNPFLYAWLNENFRKEFQMVLPCFERQSTPVNVGRWRSERTCNGNDTLHESLVPPGGGSMRLRVNECIPEEQTIYEEPNHPDNILMTDMGNAVAPGKTEDICIIKELTAEI